MITDKCVNCGAALSLATTSATLDHCPNCRSQISSPVRTMPGGQSAPGESWADDVSVLASAAHENEFASKFTLGKLIGTGSAGVVFEGVEVATSERVAIKFLSRVAKMESSGRFQQEGRLLAAIHHPNVVCLLDFGELKGFPYHVLEFLDGGTLRQRLEAQGRLPVTEAIGTTLACLSGLSACHEQGIVHRDLKPENILFSGEGQVKITDLGIAKAPPGTGDNSTQTGAIVGTPRYISPEQVTGGGETSPATDLYAMGVILFEVLVGHPPFDSDSLYTLLKMHAEQEPPRLARIASWVPAPLADLVHRVLSKDPARRPPSVAAFAAELYPILTSWQTTEGADGPLSVPPALRCAGFRRAQPRARSVWPAAASLTAVALLAAGGAWISRGPWRSQASGTVLPASAVSASSPASSIAAPAPAASQPPSRTASSASPARPAYGPILAASLGGTYLALSTRGGAIWLEPIAPGAPSHALIARGPKATALALSPDGTRLATATTDGRVRVLDVAGGQTLADAAHPELLIHLAFSPDGRLLAGFGKGEEVYCWKAVTLAPAARVAYADEVECVAFSPDSRRLGIAGGKSTWFWDLGANKLALDATAARGMKSIRYSPDGKLVAAGGENHKVHLLDAATGAVLARLEGHDDEVQALGFSPDGTRLVTGGEEGGTFQWALAPPAPAAELAGKAAEVLATGFSADGRIAIAAGKDGRVLRWDVATGQLLAAR